MRARLLPSARTASIQLEWSADSQTGGDLIRRDRDAQEALSRSEGGSRGSISRSDRRNRERQRMESGVPSWTAPELEHLLSQAPFTPRFNRSSARLRFDLLVDFLPLPVTPYRRPLSCLRKRRSHQIVRMVLSCYPRLSSRQSLTNAHENGLVCACVPYGVSGNFCCDVARSASQSRTARRSEAAAHKCR